MSDETVKFESHVTDDHLVQFVINKVAPDKHPYAYEYQVSLLEPTDNKDVTDGTVVDEWHSINETYNGQKHLTQDSVEQTIEEIVSDVRNGDVDYWFDV